MVRNKVKGNIVFITSVEGVTNMPGMFLYGSLKAAVKRSCMTIALDLAPYGIRCNCVAPGFTTVRTTDELHAQGEDDVEWRSLLAKKYPLGRVGMPEDTANMVEFLLRKESDNITGEQFRVDGAARTPRMPTSPISKEIEKSGWCYSEEVVPENSW
jgi:glucose 1-dehydrogenase